MTKTRLFLCDFHEFASAKNRYRIDNCKYLYDSKIGLDHKSPVLMIKDGVDADKAGRVSTAYKRVYGNDAPIEFFS